MSGARYAGYAVMMAAGPSISETNMIAELLGRVPYERARGSYAFLLLRRIRQALFAFTMQAGPTQSPAMRAAVVASIAFLIPGLFRSNGGLTVIGWFGPCHCTHGSSVVV